MTLSHAMDSAAASRAVEILMRIGANIQTLGRSQYLISTAGDGRSQCTTLRAEAKKIPLKITRHDDSAMTICRALAMA